MHYSLVVKQITKKPKHSPCLKHSSAKSNFHPFNIQNISLIPHQKFLENIWCILEPHDYKFELKKQNM